MTQTYQNSEVSCFHSISDISVPKSFIAETSLVPDRFRSQELNSVSTKFLSTPKKFSEMKKRLLDSISPIKSNYLTKQRKFDSYFKCKGLNPQTRINSDLENAFLDMTLLNHKVNVNTQQVWDTMVTQWPETGLTWSSSNSVMLVENNSTKRNTREFSCKTNTPHISIKEKNKLES